MVLTLGTHVSLSGHFLDFIESGRQRYLCPSPRTDATVQTAWRGPIPGPVTTEPWENGDKLMLRIRKLLPEVSLTNMPTSLEQGTTHSFTVDAGKPGPSRSSTAIVCLRTLANAELLTTASAFVLSPNPVTTTVTSGCSEPFTTFPEADIPGALFPQRVNTTSKLKIP